MTHIKQRPFECLPTAIAMLLGLTPDYVIGAVAAHPPRWDPYIDGGDIVRAIVKFVPWAKQAFAQSLMRTPSADAAAMQGTGLVFMRRTWGIRAHVVAYGDGLIYDSGLIGPVPLADYWFAFRACGMLLYPARRPD